MWTADERPEKDGVRKFIFDGVGWRDTSLWLPGEDLACIHTAMQSGVLDSDSHIIAVERDPDVARRIRQQLPHCGMSWHLHEGELHSLTLPEDVRLDYAFIDLLGYLNTDICRWMNDVMIKHMTDDFSLAVTHLYALRNSHMLRKARSLFQTTYRELYMSFVDQVEIYNKNVLLPMALLKCIFRKFDFEFLWGTKYRDTRNSMCVFRLVKFRQISRPVWPHISNFYEADDDATHNPKRKDVPMPRTSTTTRSAAARKAVRTKRERERERAALLSARALKAWKTRRANNWVHPASR